MELYQFTISDDRNYPFREIWASALRSAEERDYYEQQCDADAWPEYVVALVGFDNEDGDGEYDNNTYHFKVFSK